MPPPVDLRRMPIPHRNTLYAAEDGRLAFHALRGMSGRVAALVSGQLTSRGGVAQQVSQGHQPASWGDGERLGLGREKGGDLSA